MSTLLPLPVVVPLLTAAVLLTVTDWRVRRLLGLAATTAVLVLGVALVAATDREVLVQQLAGWPPGVAIPFVADRLAALMVTVSAVLVLTCVSFAAVTGADRPRRFWPLVLVLSAGVYGAYLTGDLFNLFVFVEVMLLPSYVLLTLDRTSQQLAAARIYVSVNLLASTVLVAGVGLVYGAAGTVNLAELAGQGARSPAVAVGAGVVAVALTVKAALVPVHGWLPRTYPHASPAVIALFSGLLTKVGVYALLRVYAVVFEGDQRYRWLIVLVAVASMIVGVLGAVGQQAMRSVLAFHMVSQTGYLALGLALFTTFGLTAMLFYLLQYVLVKAALLLAAGAVHSGYGTDRLDQLSGLARQEPLLAVAFVSAAFSLAGLPPFSGFVAKFMLVLAALQEAQYLGAATAVAVSLLTLTSMIKIWTGAFWGPSSPTRPGTAPGRVRTATVAPALVLAAASLVLGIGGQALLGLTESAAEMLVQPAGYVEAVLRR